MNTKIDKRPNDFFIETNIVTTVDANLQIVSSASEATSSLRSLPISPRYSTVNNGSKCRRGGRYDVNEDDDDDDDGEKYNEWRHRTGEEETLSQRKKVTMISEDAERPKLSSMSLILFTTIRLRFMDVISTSASRWRWSRPNQLKMNSLIFCSIMFPAVVSAFPLPGR